MIMIAHVGAKSEHDDWMHFRQGLFRPVGLDEGISQSLLD